MTYGAGYPATEDRAMPAVVYAFYILGLFHGVTLFIGLIMAYVLRGGCGPVMASHYTYLIRTFWVAAIWLVIGCGIMVASIPFTFILIGIPVMFAGGLVCGAAWLWAMVRCIVGCVRLADSQPVANPYAYGI